MSGFGELNFESSHAFADDEEEEENQYGLSIDWTKEGESYKGGAQVFCAFDGKVALGFGEGYLQGGKFTLLAEIFVTGNDSTVDLTSLRQRRKRAARLFRDSFKSSVIFALIDFYGVPRFLSNQLVEMMKPLIESASEVVIFHSEISAYNKCGEDCVGKLFYLTSSSFLEEHLSKNILKAEKLRPPNIISGPSASILTLCQQKKKAGILFAAYLETELVDSISLKPFFQAVSITAAEKEKKEDPGLNLAKLFSQFQHSIRKGADVSNLYI